MTYYDPLVVGDSLTYRLSVNLYTLNKNRDTIDLFGLDPSNPEHMWVFQTAMLNLSLFNKRIRTDNNFVTRFKLYWQNRKLVYFIKKCVKNSNEEKTVQDILEFMRPAACELMGTETFDFGTLAKKD